VGNRFVDGEDIRPSTTLASYGITKDQSSIFSEDS
jgi:hypothetical protein